MANRLEQYDDDEMSEILRRALHKQGTETVELRNRLMAVADELGISREAVAEAELEYRQETSRKQELAIYAKESRKAFNFHAAVLGIVNLFMVGLNLMTYGEDREIWFPYVLLSWGIGLAIHAFLSLRKVDWDDEEFQKWRQKRAEQRELGA